MRLLIFFLLLSVNLPGTTQNWNIQALYPSYTEWRTELDTFVQTESAPHFTRIVKYKNTIAHSPKQLAELLMITEEIERKIDKLVQYAHLRRDTALTDPQCIQAHDTALSLLNQYLEARSFIHPEVLALDEVQFSRYMESPELKSWSFYLQQLQRVKNTVLSTREEELLSLAHAPLSQFRRIFRTLNDSDLKFQSVQDSLGNEHSLTHSSYASLIKSPDQTLRKNAFKSMHTAYIQLQNSFTELLTGEIKQQVFNAKSRKFTSCLEAELHTKNIDPMVYHTLIATVKEHIAPLHRFVALKKKLLNLSELHTYDLYCSALPAYTKKYSYDEAIEIVLEAVKPLGSTYVETLEKGLKYDGWVDSSQSNNKRSGAYSFGCYDSMPYILMNFDGSLSSVITLAHETGHSMHSFFSRKNQSYNYANYDMFVAEIASLFNEELVFTYLLKIASTREEKAYLLLERLDRIRQALFRQTSFAEFELSLHEFVENNTPLTAKLLNDTYLQLIQSYYGSGLTLDPELAIEWARIAHFYRPYYVFQYATGISAAISLYTEVAKGDIGRNNYMQFLKAGGSDYPLNVLLQAGVDMRNKDPIVKAIDHFDQLLCELEDTLRE